MERRPVALDATVHHGEDPRLAGALGGAGIDHALLQPQGRQLETDAIGHDARSAERAREAGILTVMDRCIQRDRAALQ